MYVKNKKMNISMKKSVEIACCLKAVTLLSVFLLCSFSAQAGLRISFVEENRQFSIYAPSGQMEYEMLSNDYVSYNYDGQVRQVGNVYISYNYNGQVCQIGGVYISYDYDGRVRQVGGMYISYTYDGKISGTSGSVK